MAWVPGFEHDIFISYARVDDLTADPNPQQGWVSQFERHLDVALSKKVGRLNTVKLWRDTRELRGNQLFDQTIQESIQGSAVFVVLNSQGYLRSDYCRQELECFYQKAQKDRIGLAAGDDYRIFHLLLQNIARPAWPREAGRTTGFAFHDAIEGDGDGEPLPPSTELFRARLRAVAEAIYRTLTRLKEGAAADEPNRIGERRFSIYFADTSDTLSSVRKRVLNELKPFSDLQVVTGVPPPFEGLVHDGRVRAEVKAADLSVHLLDVYAGREMVEREGMSYPRRQVELALEHGNSQLIWMPQSRPGESIEDEAYAAFLEKLENGPREKASYDFTRDLPAAITRQILVKVGELKSRTESSVRSTAQSALLDTHFKDQFHALELSQYLLRQEVQPYINPQEDDPGKNLDIFTERLKQVGILILFYGAVAEEWVRARLAVTLQIAIAENCPLRACGVYVAPPRKPGSADRLRLPLVPVQWMDHTSGFNAGAVDQLLSQARAAGGRG